MGKLKKYEFANPTVSANTYAGQLALPYVSAAVKSNVSVTEGYVRVVEGFNRKAVISRLSVTDPLAAASCSFSATDTDLNETVISLTDLQANVQYCRKTVYPTWIGQGMDRNGNLPQSFEEFLLETISANIGQSLENQMWRGGTAFGTGFLSNDGTLDETGADLSALKDFTEYDFTNAIDKDDIDDYLAGVYDSAVANHPGLIADPTAGFYMNNKTYAFYQQHLASSTTFQAQGYNAKDIANLTYLGRPIYVCPGIFDDVIVFTKPENLVMGTNALSDLTEVRVIPTYQYDGSDNINIVMRFAAGVGAAVPTEGVFGSTVWT